MWLLCELADRKEMSIVEIVRCSRQTLWRFCGVWYCDSLQCHKKTKIRSLAKQSRHHWAIHYFLSDSSASRTNALIANLIDGPSKFQFSIIADKSESGTKYGCAGGCAVCKSTVFPKFSSRSASLPSWLLWVRVPSPAFNRVQTSQESVPHTPQ